MSVIYILNRTDPDNPPIVVQPYSVNGTLTPGSTSPLYPKAVSASTSLLFVGKGDFDYGPPVQQNFVYLLENFANSSPPVLPLQGQLWYDNQVNQMNVCISTNPTINWTQLFFANGSIAMTGDLNLAGNDIIMGGGNITNIVLPGSPLPTNVATIGYVDARTSGLAGLLANYVLKAGDTMTGPLTLSGLPTLPAHAANKRYVDSASTLYVLKAGDTMTGNLVMTLGTKITLNSGPTTPTDAANKRYVDSLISGGPTLSSSVSYTTTGIISGTILSLTLFFPGSGYVDGVYNNQPLTGGSGTGATANIVVSGGAVTSVTLVSGGTSYLVAQGLSAAIPGGTGLLITVNQIFTTYSYLRDAIPPGFGVNQVTDLQQVTGSFDTRLGELTQPSTRYVFRVTAPITLPAIFGLPFPYKTETNSLSVYVNGVKRFLAPRAFGLVSVGARAPNTQTNLLTGSYNFTIAVDGAPAVPVNIGPVTLGAYTYRQLLNDLQAAVPAGVTVTFYQGTFTFYSGTQGIPSDITLTAGTLWIVGNFPGVSIADWNTSTLVSDVYTGAKVYVEQSAVTGPFVEPAQQVTFPALMYPSQWRGPFAVGDIIEFIKE